MTEARSNHLQVIWRLLDGKAGHESQTAGLVSKLNSLCDCEVFDISVPELSRLPTMLFDWRSISSEALLTPNIIVAAGHRTHLWLLLSAWRTGAKSIVLMTPTLPYSLFDLCLIPEHDEPTAGRNIIATRGALNSLTRADTSENNKMFIMIGGPSKRHGWNEEKLLSDIKKLTRSSEYQITITDSPRTPGSTSNKLTTLENGNTQYHAFANTSREWLIGQLQVCSTHWVTEDSISMIYESLTARGCTYVLSIPRLREDKITHSIDTLYKDRNLLTLNQWRDNIQPKRINLDESSRCAEMIFEKYIQDQKT